MGNVDSIPHPEPAAIGVIGRTAPGILSSDSYMTSSGSSILSPGPSVPSPLHTRSGKAKSGKAKNVAQPPYGRGVVYLPGDINGLGKKLRLLAAEFFAGNTTARNELVHVLDALLRLKQLTRKEYADIIARLVASL